MWKSFHIGWIWKRIVDEGVAFAWDHSSLSQKLGDEMTIVPFFEFCWYYLPICDVLCPRLAMSCFCCFCCSWAFCQHEWICFVLMAWQVFRHVWTWCFCSNRSASDVTCKWIRRGVCPSCEVTNVWTSKTVKTLVTWFTVAGCLCLNTGMKQIVIL